MLDYVKERAVATGPLANSTLLPFLLYILSLEKFTPITKNCFRSEYDYVIVGAGSAGSVVASRLTELPYIDALLLETGESPPILSDVPFQAAYLVGSYIDWQMQSVPQRHLKDRILSLPAGKAVGGSSVINFMANVRGNRRDYDGWAKQGAVGWSYEEVLPYFKKLESMQEPKYFDAEYHGFSGPITMERPPYNSIFREKLFQAVRDLGYHFVDTNGAHQYGIYDLTSSLRNGRRCSVGKGYLAPVDNRPNLDIIQKAHVTKIIIENNRAVGVEVKYNGTMHTVKVRKEVIISAGAVHTPQLLMLSGIGPKAHLKKMKIPVVADLPVGLNFQDQFATFMVFELSSSIPSLENKAKNPINILKYAFTNTGPLSSPVGIALTAFLSNGTNAFNGVSPEFQLFIHEGQPPFSENKFEGKTLVYCTCLNMHPKSRGKITLNTTNPEDQPLIDPNSFDHPGDMKYNVAAIKTCRKIMLSDRLRELGIKPLKFYGKGCDKYEDNEDNYFSCLVRKFGFSFIHYCGTAKMGSVKDPTTVVDEQLRVKGICGLRVIDASVMPYVTSGNTNIPTIMIAEKASDLIKQSIFSS